MYDTPESVAALVQDKQVHRDVYTSPEVFRLEMKHLFANAWVFVGHESQTPNKGDYFSTSIGDQPVIQVRHTGPFWNDDGIPKGADGGTVFFSRAIHILLICN